MPVLFVGHGSPMNVIEDNRWSQGFAALRELVPSGNAVHNLRDAFRRMQTRSTDTPDWAQRFDATVERVVAQHDTTNLLSLWPDSDDGRLAHPTPDHWLPLIYAQAATDDRDRVRFPTEGFDWGSISMRNIVFG